MNELVSFLGDPRPAVQQRSICELSKRDGVRALAAEIQSGTSNSTARRHAVWTSSRIDDTEARAAVRTALRDAHETVRPAAIHSVSVWRDRDALPALLNVLQTGSH